MSERAFYALVRREVHRGRRPLLLLSGVSAVALIVALVGAGWVAVFAVIPAMLASFLALGGPSIDLAEDKLQGYLEHDRVLPVSTRLIAAGRLTGAAIRVSPVGISALALAVAIGRDERLPVTGVLLVLIPLGALLLAALVSWTLLACNARWQFRHLWWVPITVILAPQFAGSLLPPSVKVALGRGARGLGLFFLELAATPPGAILLIGAIVALPIAVFAAATLLFASGLERYRYDANVLGAVLGKAPKRELGAIGRGPLLAVARLRIRIAAEQQWRQLAFLAVLLVVLAVGSRELGDFARVYVRVLAVMLPAGIAMQLMQARGMGYLEGLRQLPHPARTLALGHLAAVAAMAVPGAAVVLVARAVNGTPVRVTDGIVVWGWFLTGAWIAAVLAVWLQRRHVLLIAGLIVLPLLGGLLLLGGAGLVAVLADAARGFRRLRSGAGAALPVAAAALVALVGLPLFARGVERYQFKVK